MWSVCGTNWGAFGPQVITDECILVQSQLQAFVTSPEGAIASADAIAWLPSPAKLGELEKQWMPNFAWGTMNVLAWGARAYERVGLDDKAEETAKLAFEISKKKTTIADCQCLLGRLAARRGNEEEAKAAFRAAAETARVGKWHMLGIVAGHELKRHVPAASEEADAIIDAACLRMGKDRTAFARLLA